MTDRVHFVILSVDAKSDAGEDHPALRRPTVGEWTQTEGDEQYDFDYLSDEFGDESYRDGLHRKFVGYLSEDELDAWLEKECWGTRQDAREAGEATMGSITPDGHFPAYSLTDEQGSWNVGGYDPVIHRNSYVTEYAYGEPPADQLESLKQVYGF